MTVEEVRLLITRIGQQAKVIFTGDISGHQSDLKNQISGLSYILTSIGHGSISNRELAKASAFVKFSDSDSLARSPILPHVLGAMNDESNPMHALMRAFEVASPRPARTHAIEQARLAANDALDKGARNTIENYVNKIKRLFPDLSPRDTIAHLRPRHSR